MKKRMTVSLLAQTLKELIKASGKSRTDWTFILQVSPAALSQWLSDKTLPSPKHIKSFVDVVRRLDGAGPAIERFYEMAELPAREVTPHYEKITKNIDHYIAEQHFRPLHQRVDAMVYRCTLRENEENWRKIAEFFTTLSK